MEFVREALIYVLEASGIGRTVIGRQAHADQHYFDVAVSGLGDDMIEVVVHVLEWQTAQAVVPAQFHDEDIRVMPVQQWRNAVASPGGGFSADAGVDDPTGGAPLL